MLALPNDPVLPDTTTPSANESDATSLAVVRVDDYAAFLDLALPWNALAAERSIFLRHEWFDAAWQWRSRDDMTRLAILCAYRGTCLVGVWPLLHCIEPGGMLARRILEFLTVPDTQLCDILVAADLDQNLVVAAFANHLAARCRDWDALRLRYVPADAVAITKLPEVLRGVGMDVVVTPAGGNPYVRLDIGWEDYYATRSRRLKKANNLTVNRLKKTGDILITRLAPGISSEGDTAAMLDTAIAISAKSWKRTTGNALDQPGPQAFIRRLSKLAAERGWLSLWLLALDGKPMAMEYQLVFNGHVHALRGDVVDGYDEISPGSYLHRHQLEQLCGGELRRYLMGPGDNPYKRHWSDEAEPLFRLDAYSTSTRGKLAALWSLKIRPGLRALKALFQYNKKVESA